MVEPAEPALVVAVGTLSERGHITVGGHTPILGIRPVPGAHQARFSCSCAIGAAQGEAQDPEIGHPLLACWPVRVRKPS